MSPAAEAVYHLQRRTSYLQAVFAILLHDLELLKTLSQKQLGIQEIPKKPETPVVSCFFVQHCVLFGHTSSASCSVYAAMPRSLCPDPHNYWAANYWLQEISAKWPVFRPAPRAFQMAQNISIVFCGPKVCHPEQKPRLFVDRAAEAYRRQLGFPQPGCFQAPETLSNYHACCQFTRGGRIVANTEPRGSRKKMPLILASI
jgi:hypothetical protein